MRYIKGISMIISLIIISGCSKNIQNVVDMSNSSAAQRIADPYLPVLEDFTMKLSRRADGSDTFIKSFQLTDMKNDRKARASKIASELGIERDFNELKASFRDVKFVLIIWEKWYRKWKEGEISPYFTYDPMVDEDQITSVKLYKNGRMVDVIGIEDFDNFPIVVLSPEWWEGNYRYTKERKSKSSPSPPFLIRSRPFIFKIKINRWFDGGRHWYNPGWRMEIYTKTWPIIPDSMNHEALDESDFANVDEAFVWYNVIGNIHPGMNQWVNYRCEVWEADGGLRFNDDFVGRFTISGAVLHYVSGGYAEAYCVNMGPFKK